MPTLLLKHWKLLAVLLLCLGSFAAGRWGAPSSTTKTTDKMTDKSSETSKLDETVQDHDVTQMDKTTTVTKKADGSTVTVISDHSKIVDTKKKTEDETDKKADQKTETKTTTTTVSGGSAGKYDNYSLSLGVQNDASLKWNPDYQATVGYRLIGPLWGNVNYDITNHKPGVGITLTFP